MGLVIFVGCFVWGLLKGDLALMFGFAVPLALFVYSLIKNWDRYDRRKGN